MDHYQAYRAQRPEEAEYNGHTFTLPRMWDSVCPGCGQNWSKIISHMRRCGEPDPAPTPSNLIPVQRGPKMEDFDTVGRFTIHRSVEGVVIMARPDLAGSPVRLVVPPQDVKALIEALMTHVDRTSKTEPISSS